MAKISIINYGMGNIWSVRNALDYLNIPHNTISDAKEFQYAEMFILPGVGSFKKAMENILFKNFLNEINEQILIKKKKILGICLGMQLLCESSDEDGRTLGLNYFNKEIININFINNNLKVPHIGFNKINNISKSKLFKNIQENNNFYFVHSHCLMKKDKNFNCYMTNYDFDFVSSFENENIFGTQFHPEKSQHDGLKVIKNFFDL